MAWPTWLGNFGIVPTREEITETINNYLTYLAAGDADGITSLYSADAKVEDPVGSDAARGQDAIRAFYKGINGVAGEAELLTLRIVGNEAAFHFRFASTLGGSQFRIAPIDFMEFDDDAKITSMRAFWSQED